MNVLTKINVKKVICNLMILVLLINCSLITVYAGGGGDPSTNLINEEKELFRWGDSTPKSGWSVNSNVAGFTTSYSHEQTVIQLTTKEVSTDIDLRPYRLAIDKGDISYEAMLEYNGTNLVQLDTGDLIIDIYDEKDEKMYASSAASHLIAFFNINKKARLRKDLGKGAREVRYRVLVTNTGLLDGDASVAFANPVFKLIDSGAPGVLSIDVVNSNTKTNYYPGETIQIEITFDENMNCTSREGFAYKPALRLSNGDYAIYKEGNGTNKIIFEYNVKNSDTDYLHIEDIAFERGIIGDIIGRNEVEEVVEKQFTNILLNPSTPPSIVDDIHYKTYSGKLRVNNYEVEMLEKDFKDVFVDSNKQKMGSITIMSLPQVGQLTVYDKVVKVGDIIENWQIKSLKYKAKEDWMGNDLFTYVATESGGDQLQSNGGSVHIEVIEGETIFDGEIEWIEDTDYYYTIDDFVQFYNEDDDEASMDLIQIMSLPDESIGRLYQLRSGQELPVVKNQYFLRGEVDQLFFRSNVKGSVGDTAFEWKMFNMAKDIESNEAIITMKGIAVNDQPEIKEMMKGCKVNDTISFGLEEFEGHYSDEEGDSLADIQVLSLPEKGELKLGDASILANQVINRDEIALMTFSAESISENPPLEVSFSWTASDGNSYSETNSILISIEEPPVAKDSTIEIKEEVKGALPAFILLKQHFSDKDLEKIKIIDIQPGMDMRYANHEEYKDYESEDALVDDIAKFRKVEPGQEFVDKQAILIFSMEENFNGVTGFEWKGSNGKLYSNSANMVFNVLPVNDKPVVGDFEKKNLAGQPISLDSEDFIRHFKDVDMDELKKIKVLSLPENGQLSFQGNAVTENQELDINHSFELVFTPDAESFDGGFMTYQGFDGTDFSNEGKVSFATNQRPLVEDVSIDLTNNPIYFKSSDFIAAFKDADMDELGWIIFDTLPTNGILYLEDDNGKTPIKVEDKIDRVHIDHILFEPANNWRDGGDFDYRASDLYNYSEGAKVNFVVKDHGPEVNNFEINYTENDKVKLVKDDFVKEFTDADGDDLEKIKITRLPVNGRLQVNGIDVVVGTEYVVDDKLELEYLSEETGMVSRYFEWQAYDGYKYSNLVQVRLNQFAQPRAKDFEMQVKTNTALFFNADHFIDNFVSNEASELRTVKFITLPSDGIFTHEKAGNIERVQLGVDYDVYTLEKLVFTPIPNFIGKTEFEWSGQDEYWESNVGTVSIDVGDSYEEVVNTPPVITGFSKEVKANRQNQFSFNEFDGAYKDAEGDKLKKIIIESIPENSTLTIAGEEYIEGEEISSYLLNDLEFEFNSQAEKEMFLEYRAYDGNEYSNTGLVTITIKATSNNNGGSGNSNDEKELEDEELAEGLLDESLYYDDLSDYIWAVEAINFLTGEKIVEGRESRIYEPGEKITRAEFAAYLVNLMGAYDEDAKDYFEDVSDDERYGQHIASAYVAGLIKGYSKEKYGPDDYITRQDVMVIMARAMKLKIEVENGDFEALLFLDKEMISEYAREGVTLTVSNQLIEGYDVEKGREIRPKNNMNRAEAAMVVYRLFKKMEK